MAAIRASQTNVNKCGTVSNNPRDPRAGGAFNPACVLPRPISMPVTTLPGASTGPGGVFVVQQPVRPRIDSILPKGYIK